MSEPASKFGEPPHDWSHVYETINMLYLAVCQIEATLADSNQEVDTLTHSFTQLAKHTNEVSDQIQNLTRVEEFQVFKKDLSNTAQEMTQQITASIQAFQFYDRVCQRLDHVARGLEKVTKVMGKQDQRDNPTAWRQIQNDIKNSYTMEAERIMFEYIMRGGTVSDALNIYRHHFEMEKENKDNTDDEIELF